jgi:hypothetical protein
MAANAQRRTRRFALAAGCEASAMKKELDGSVADVVQ